MDEATYLEVFGWVLRQVTRAGLLKGKTIGIDATTLKANAAMKSIVRRDTDESYTEYLMRLAEAARVKASDEAALRRMDRPRKKKGSNAEWVNPHDPKTENIKGEFETLASGWAPAKGNAALNVAGQMITMNSLRVDSSKGDIETPPRINGLS